jgi:hypothetical protein
MKELQERQCCSASKTPSKVVSVCLNKRRYKRAAGSTLRTRTREEVNSDKNQATFRLLTPTPPLLDLT